jgi:putative membrane protein
VFNAAPVLAQFPHARPLGEGAQSRVFALSQTRVLRVPKGGSAGFWARRTVFCDRLAELDLGFQTPVVVGRGEVGGVPFSIEERMVGQDLTAALPLLDDAARERAFDSYLNAAITLGTVSLGERWYGEVLADQPVRATNWGQFLCDRVRAHGAAASTRVRADLPELDQLVADFCEEAVTIRVHSPHLVHGDYFPGNVIVDESGENIVGVADFASQTMSGDPALDIAGALAFLEITPGLRPADVQRLQERVEQLAPLALRRVSTYRRFYALSYLHAIDDDPPLYRWCLETLRTRPVA